MVKSNLQNFFPITNGLKFREYEPTSEVVLQVALPL